MLKQIENERSLALFLIFLSALLSTFLTNDISLFIVVPLTMSMQKKIKNDIILIVIFEVIAVNVGSSLTPIGNPQNLFLWHKWGISFFKFILIMIPFESILLGLLGFFSWVTFASKKNQIKKDHEPISVVKIKLFIVSMISLILYIIFLKQYLLYVVGAVFFMYFLFYKQVIAKVDWLLLLLFAILFIDFNIITTIPLVMKIANRFYLYLPANSFLFSSFLSQFVSNVPASVFVSKLSHNWRDIIFGVNVGEMDLLYLLWLIL